jgi:hypothetical protein
MMERSAVFIYCGLSQLHARRKSERANLKRLERGSQPPSRHESIEDLQQAVNGYYQTGKQHVVSFWEKFGYTWKSGIIYLLPQPG